MRGLRANRMACGIAEVDESGEAPGTRYLDPIVEDLDANVVADHAVGAMHGRVDDALEPGVLGNERHVLERPLGTQGPASWLQVLDLPPRVG